METKGGSVSLEFDVEIKELKLRIENLITREKVLMEINELKETYMQSHKKCAVKSSNKVKLFAKIKVLQDRYDKLCNQIEEEEFSD